MTDWSKLDVHLNSSLSPSKRVALYIDNPKTCLPEQRRFIGDISRRKAALCSRRAGKTIGILLHFLKLCTEHDNRKCLYIALTYGTAKDIAWDDLKQLDRALSLGCRWNEVELKATLPNGSSIKLAGADKPKEIEKFRGQKFIAVALDECGSFGDYMRSLVDEVLSPALMDFNGYLILLGTPAARHAGLFYEATTQESLGWSLHGWTWEANYLIPEDPHAWIAKERERRGLKDSDAIYLREYCGRWARGSDRLVYQFDADKNVWRTPPVWTDCFLGMDFGYIDDTALVVVGYNKTDPTLYVLETYKSPRMLTDAIAAEVRRLDSKYPLRRLVGDSGGYGKGPIEELKARYGLRIYPAEKTDKARAFTTVNNDLRTGRIKIPAGSALGEEWQNLLLTDKGEEDPSCPNHLADAFLYAFRHAKHYRGSPPEVVKVDPEAALFAAVQRKVLREREAQSGAFRFEPVDGAEDIG